MVFCCQDYPYYQDRPCYQNRPFNDKVEFYRNSWNLMESRPITIEVGFLSESVS